MTSNRKKPGVAFWASVVAVVGYLPSFGPYLWFHNRFDFEPIWVGDAAYVFFTPANWLCDNLGRLGQFYSSYCDLWIWIADRR